MVRDVTTGLQSQMKAGFVDGLSRLNLGDRFLFDETMEDKEAYQAVVSILLENEIELLEKPETEKELFGRGLYRYTFEGVCTECPELSLGDGAVRVFINTRGTNKEDFSQEFLDFMDYINASTDEAADRTDSKRIKAIHEKIRKIKISEKMGVKYMQRWEEIVYAREEGRSEGKKEGIKEGLKVKAEMLVKNVESVMENFHVDLQRACEGLGTTTEEYYKARDEM